MMVAGGMIVAIENKIMVVSVMVIVMVITTGLEMDHPEAVIGRQQAV